MSSGAIKANLSGISRHITRFLATDVWYFLVSFWRCVFSITKITSAHLIISRSSGLSASRFVPAEAVSIPSMPEKYLLGGRAAQFVAATYEKDSSSWVIECKFSQKKRSYELSNGVERSI